jgi:co-chaperonin GroES (HSP10)
MSEQYRFKQGKRTYVARGYHLLVEVDEVVVPNTLIRMANEEQEKERQLMARTSGVVRAVGPLSYNDEAEARCQVGDHVSFFSYTGRDVNRGDDGRLQKDVPLLRWMTDKEIIGILIDDEEEVK